MINAFKPLPISEARFQDQVIQIARTFGWRVAHFRPGMDRRGKWKTAVSGDGEGFPDLVLVHVKTHDKIHAEIKSDKGQLTPEQKEWIEILDGVVWRPKDFNLMRARLMCHHAGPRRGDDVPPLCGTGAVPGCLRASGHSGFHTTAPAIAEREDRGRLQHIPRRAGGAA